MEKKRKRLRRRDRRDLLSTFQLENDTQPVPSPPPRRRRSRRPSPPPERDDLHVDLDPTHGFIEFMDDEDREDYFHGEEVMDTDDPMAEEAYNRREDARAEGKLRAKRAPRKKSRMERNLDRLLHSDLGVVHVMDTFPKLCAERGWCDKSKPIEDRFDDMLWEYEKWLHELFPTMPFMEALEFCESVSNKAATRNAYLTLMSRRKDGEWLPKSEWPENRGIDPTKTGLSARRDADGDVKMENDDAEDDFFRDIDDDDPEENVLPTPPAGQKLRPVPTAAELTERSRMTAAAPDADGDVVMRDAASASAAASRKRLAEKEIDDLLALEEASAMEAELDGLLGDEF